MVSVTGIDDDDGGGADGDDGIGTVVISEALRPEGGTGQRRKT